MIQPDDTELKEMFAACVFDNDYWNYKAQGIYVDIVSNEAYLR